MIGPFLIALREGIEASLVVAIIFAQLVRSGRGDLKRYVIGGAAVGLIVSLVLAIFSVIFLTATEYEQNPIVEGLILLFSAVFIAYVPFLLHKQTNQESLRLNIENRLRSWGIFLFVFFSVFREGVEMMVFMLGTARRNNMGMALGSFLGLSLAVLIVILVFRYSIRVNLNIVFTLLSLVLIYLGGEMLGESLEKLFDSPAILQVAGRWFFIAGAVFILFRRGITLK